MENYKEYLIFTRLTPWQDWTMAAQADTPESAILAAQIHRDYYLDEESDILIARYQDMDDLCKGLLSTYLGEE